MPNFPFKVPLAESNIEWEKETEESLYDRLAYNIHMPQVIFMLKKTYIFCGVKISHFFKYLSLELKTFPSQEEDFFLDFPPSKVNFHPCKNKERIH